VTTELNRRLNDHRNRMGARISGEKRRTFFIVTGIVLVLLVIAVFFLYFDGSVNKVRRAIGLDAMSNKVNILVLGVDERANDAGRSDTMLAFFIDTNTGQFSLMSVPKDTRVKIPGHEWDKMNHAYAEGKYKLAMKSAEELMGIPFDYYVVINFDGFCKVIDAIGGIDVEVEKRMVYQDPADNLYIDIQPGMQHMDGKTALQYARYRDGEDDIGRIDRQQKLIKAVLKQVTSPDIIVKIPAIIQEVASAIKSDISTRKMLQFAKILNASKADGLVVEMVPGTPATLDNVKYWLPDIVALRSYIAQVLEFPLDEKALKRARELADEYQQSIPKEMVIHDTTPSPDKVKPTLKPEEQKGVKPETAKAPLPPGSDKLTVVVVNASGKTNAGAKMAALLKSRGFEVVGVGNAPQLADNSSVISYSKDSAVCSKLTGLPFDYVLQVKPDDTRAVKASVVIGLDYE